MNPQHNNNFPGSIPPEAEPTPPVLAQPDSASQPMPVQPRDNYAIAQSVYPDPTQIRSQLPAYPTEEIRQAEAAVSSSSLTLLLGLASPLSYMVVLYLAKNLWAVGIVSVLLAAGAIYFALNNYRTSRELSPSTVIGLAAATITIVNVGNAVVAQLMVNSTLHRLGY